MSYVIANLASPRDFFFFLILWRVWMWRVEEGGWFYLPCCIVYFFDFARMNFSRAKKKKKLYLCSYFYELWILNNYCVFEFINKFRLIEHKWDFLSFLTIISSLTRKTVRKDVWLLYIIFSNICFNYSNIRGEEWIK